MASQDYDVIVVGAGLAGLVAGTRAAERGLRVAVLEKGADPRYACNTRWSGGIIHVGYTDPKEPPQAIRAAIERHTRGHTDPDLAEALITDTGKVIDWAIQAHGGGGTSNDFGLAAAYAMSRVLRLADGPDEVHRQQLAKMELKKYR